MKRFALAVLALLMIAAAPVEPVRVHGHDGYELQDSARALRMTLKGDDLEHWDTAIEVVIDHVVGKCSVNGAIDYERADAMFMEILDGKTMDEVLDFARKAAPSMSVPERKERAIRELSHLH